MTNQNNLQKITVLYHDNCLDGFGAAYAVWRYYGDAAQYIPVTYDKPVPIQYCVNAIVYLVDFCYPIDKMADVCAAATDVIILDHHTTSAGSIEKLQQQAMENEWLCTITGKHRTDRSGAVITWDWFFPGDSLPPLLAHIQDVDLWQFKLADTKEITAAFNNTVLVPRTFKHWHTIVERWGHWPEGLVDWGTSILADREIRCTNLVNKAYPVCFQGHYGLAVNAPYDIRSELGNILAEKSGTFGAVWQYNGFGKYNISLRSTKTSGFDVSALAAKCGGGGHANAAGFNYDTNTEEGRELEAMWQEVK